MSKQLLVYLVLIIAILGFASWRWADQIFSRVSLRSDEMSFTTIARVLVLPVPYTSEMPEGIEKRPWVNACEEATIVMVDKYYAGDKTISTSTAVGAMKTLFAAQDKLYKSNDNSSAERTAYLINNYSSYRASTSASTTIEQIKEQLRAGRPVISFHYGFDLKNPNIPFAPRGSSYHSLVIIGYDDEQQEFITHDPGDLKAGPNHRYKYDIIMGSLHDYDYKTKKADGPARVLFTAPHS